MQFRFKLLQTPLFGPIAARSPDAFRDLFAKAHAPLTLHLDEAALDAVATDLELDVDGVAADALRYVEGRFRAGAEGLGGNRIGDFGEAIAYLALRTMASPGEAILRVVGTVGSAGGRAPQPDFLLRRGRQMGVIEVKSCEALKFQRLVGGRPPKPVAACDRVRARRRDALDQLGFLPGGARVSQPHRLRIGKRTVPFPADFGEALVLTLWDGRLDALSPRQRGRAPKPCRHAGRDCWTCFGRPGTGTSNGALVRMPNAPGHLALLGGEGSDEWLSAYAEWTAALWSRSGRSAEHASRQLLKASDLWLGRRPGSTKVLRRLLREYIDAALLERGLRAASDEASPASQSEPSSRGEFSPRTAAGLLESRGPARLELREGQFPGSVTLAGDRITIRTWLPPGAQRMAEPSYASGTVGEVLRDLLQVADRPTGGFRLRPLVVEVTWPVGGGERLERRELPVGFVGAHDTMPGARLFVLPDGRATVTASRTEIRTPPTNTTPPRTAAL